MFPGAKGGPIRRGNFNKMAAWPQAVASIGMPGLHFHDLRNTGNQFAANSGAGLRDLMARMGHDSERAAMVYQHVARGADQVITGAIDTHDQGEKRGDADGEDGAAGVLVPLANGTLMARRPGMPLDAQGPSIRETVPDLGPSWLERVTGIEPALSAWEADVLPLNYTRAHRSTPPGGGVSRCLPRHRTGTGRLLACSYLTETSRRRSGRGG